jgi:hypothetical protein
MIKGFAKITKVHTCSIAIQNKYIKGGQIYYYDKAGSLVWEFKKGEDDYIIVDKLFN